MEEGSFLGLGFPSFSGAQEGHRTTIPASIRDIPTGNAAVDAADALMKHYLRQCPDYHNEQHDQQQEDPSPSNQQQQPLTTQFVAAAQQQQLPAASLENHTSMVLDVPTIAVLETAVTLPPVQCPPRAITELAMSQTYVTNATYTAAQASMAKARAIVEKFHQQQQLQHLVPVTAESLEATMTKTNSTIAINPTENRHRREQCLVREKRRLHEAMLKNFEYVACREEKRLQQQLQQLEQTRHFENQLTQRYAITLQQRQQEQQQNKKKKFVSKAGIGTSHRQTLKQTKQQKGYDFQQQDGVAVYISGLPITEDGSSLIKEDGLKQMFTSYGSIQKVHFYRDRKTGQMKGDALVVYENRNKNEKYLLLNTVCSQMTGARLPCGSVLQVEPANSESKYSSTQNETASNHGVVTEALDDEVDYYGPAAGAAAAVTATIITVNEKEEKDEHDENEDLDDFFASLT